MLDEDIRRAAELLSGGDQPSARRLARRALAGDPADAAALQLIGVIVEASAEAKLSAPWFARTASVLSESPVPLVALASALMRNGGASPARRPLRRALSLTPDADRTMLLLAESLEPPADAEPWLRRAVAISPESAAAGLNLAVHLRRQGALDAAGRAVRVAAARNPAVPEILSNLSMLAIKRRETAAAENWAERALAVRPDFAEARWNRAIVRLLQGRLAEGWADSEARWRLPPHNGERHPSAKRWRGEPLAGRRLLVHAEQGLGDTIQFCRYVPRVAERGVSVTLAVPAPLERLARTLKGPAEVIVGDGLGLDYERHCPLMSLPGIFATTLSTIPADIPYLSVPGGVADPAAWLPKKGAGLRVGLSWHGNPAHDEDRERSIPASLLAPLLAVPGTEFIALRKDGESLPREWPILDAAPRLGDMADTAAVVASLDLVIAVDSAVAHLAGALGRPVWTLLAFAGEWRWLTDRDTSPWYPTMRLFRQRRLGDWAAVIAVVAEALAETARNER